MNRLTFGATGLVAGLCPASAWAHPGHGENGFAAGMVHPLSGMDHLAAMVLVGMLAALLAQRIAWLVPAAFLGGLLSGFAAGFSLPQIWLEYIVLLSVAAFGAAAFLHKRIPALPVLFATAIFGYAHGAAHGMEMPKDAVPDLFASGFLVMSILLHGAGYWLVRVFRTKAYRPARSAFARTD